MKKILLGVTGSIAAYKSAEIASKLVKLGYDVHVIMTESATKFVAPLTFETLTRNRVYVDMFREEDHRQVRHISESNESDLILVAPASYNIIGKTATGVADDFLSSVLAAAPANKVIFAPAMNVNMYHNPILQENINKLTKLGYRFIEPEEGMLACGVLGKGCLRNVPSIIETVEGFFHDKLLQGKKVLITAGATREYIDPIRFISNSSSGLMGVSLAKACRDFGADVTLILANSHLNIEGVNLIRVQTVAEMYQAAVDHFPTTDLMFAAAAVSDFKPVTYSESKIKKSDTGLVVELERNTDILLELGKMKQNQLLIGFAAESENLIPNAVGKLNKKNLDLIIANDLSNFATDDGKVWLVTSETAVELERKPKLQLAYDIVKMILNMTNNLSGAK